MRVTVIELLLAKPRFEDFLCGEVSEPFPIHIELVHWEQIDEAIMIWPEGGDALDEERDSPLLRHSIGPLEDGSSKPTLVDGLAVSCP